MFDSNGVKITSAINLETCLRWHFNGSETILHILVHVYVTHILNMKVKNTIDK